jgi:hypothetical protein
MSRMHKIGLAVVVAAGLATMASAQQTGRPPTPQQIPPNGESRGQMMGHGGSMGHGMMMMDDPRMQAEMMGMMRSCGRMMESMAEMPQRRPRG